MRLWTLHPRYLDRQGLLALWREGLLARAVLRGRTRGYRHHPQLQRFRAHPYPLAAINAYLGAVAEEAARRGYAFDRRKLGPVRAAARLPATRGQLRYEWSHLLRKLRQRSPTWYERWQAQRRPRAHPLFTVKPGAIAVWERSGRRGIADGAATHAVWS